jgi:hypothetical protein
MEIITPGVEQLKQSQHQENPYLMTNFGFQRTTAKDEDEKEFMENLTSGLLWEDGTRFAMGLIADRNAQMLAPEDVIGGLIDPADDFWHQPSDNGMTLVQNMIWHQSYHQHAVVFGRKDEWSDDSKRGAGYFRLAIDSSQAKGDRRWAMAEFETTGVNPGSEHRHFQESIGRMKDHGWTVWKIEETYPSGYGQPSRKRMVLFVVAPEPWDHKRFKYYMEKSIMKQLSEHLVFGNHRSPFQPARRAEGNMMPLPCMDHPLIKTKVAVKKM